MKPLIYLFSLALFFSFVETESVIFSSNNKKISITADNSWHEKANMKGVEIYIIRNNSLDNSTVSIVVSKDEGLLENTSLEKYSAGKIFLQTTVLQTSPQLTINKMVNDMNATMYEYEYTDKEMNSKKSVVYHTVVGRTGYQFVITGQHSDFENFRPYFNQIINSIKIQ